MSMVAWRKHLQDLWANGPLSSLRRQLVVGVALIVGTTSTLFIWHQTNRLHDDWSAQQVSQAKVLAESVAAASALWLAARDDNGLQEVVTALKPFPDLAHVMVLDRRQRILAHSDPQYRGQYLQDFSPATETSVLANSRPFVDVVSPVRLGEQHIGWVRVGLTGRDLGAKIEDASRRGLFDAVIALLLSLLVASAAGTALTRRLGRIQNVAERVQKGDLQGRVHLSGSDEAARLAGHFDQMLDSLMQGRQALTLAANVFTHAREAIMITDADMAIIKINEAFTQITGMGAQEVVGQTPYLLRRENLGTHTHDDMKRQLETANHWQGELNCQRKDGAQINVLLTISAVRDDTGQTVNYVGFFSDITQAKHHELELEHKAHYDTLTGLPNRVLLGLRLEQSLRKGRDSGESVSVVFLDLDGFKVVNDQHGHAVGDRLLVSVANRMKRVLRDDDTLARIGGDEFVALVQGVPGMDTSIPVIERLLSVVSEPVVFDGLELHVTASLGVTSFPQSDDVDADHLLRQADQAMYAAKTSGKNSYVVFDAEKDRHQRSRLDRIQQLRHALRANELVLHYQPRIHLASGHVVGVEALVRWQHPQLGLLPPGDFLPLIQGDPLMISLGRWVLRAAVVQLLAWRETGLELPVSVNLDATDLQDPSFASHLRELIADHPGLREGDLGLEILETAALADVEAVAGIIRNCERWGVHFCLDDFGTGYSSLTYLRTLPVKVLKVDQSFVRDMFSRDDDMSILRGVMGMAEAFDLETVAEGVETAEQAEVLRSLGCACAQGYAIARPMAAQAIEPWVQRWQALDGLDAAARIRMLKMPDAGA